MIRDLSKMYPPARHPVSWQQKQPRRYVKRWKLAAARLMRNQFRSSFRAAARSHGQLRSLSHCCSCMRDSVSVRGLTYEKSEQNQKAILITKAFCHPQSCVCVCVLTLNFGDSVLPLFPHMLLGLAWGPPPAGTAVKVHCHRVLRPDQRGVPLPSSSVSQVRV